MIELFFNHFWISNPQSWPIFICHRNQPTKPGVANHEHTQPANETIL